MTSTSWDGISLRIATPEQMEQLGEEIGVQLRAGDLVILSGELGAGKTTLTRGIAVGLGVRGPITSPTFVLARTHPSLDFAGTPLVHADAYRLSDAVELDDLDIDWPASVSVVEWGDGMVTGVAESWLRVRIDRQTGLVTSDDALHGSLGLSPLEDDDLRQVRIEGFGPRWHVEDASHSVVANPTGDLNLAGTVNPVGTANFTGIVNPVGERSSAFESLRESLEERWGANPEPGAGSIR